MATKAAKKKATASRKSIEKAHAGKPVSPTEDPTDHSTSAASIAAKTDPSGKGGATVNAASMDAVSADMKNKEDADRLAEDQSIFGKARRAGIFWVNDHSRGGGPYIGISPQNDPKADQASKERSTVEPLELHAPRTGLQVRLPDGTSFNIPDGFGNDTTPNDWARVVRPDGKPLFE
jgi:hypothetical protein